MQFDTQSLWIYLYFPQLQLNVMEQRLSEPDTQARVIYKHSNNQCVQVNQTALTQGIKAGMGLANASLLCQNLKVIEYRGDIEEQALQHLANQLYLVTSDIALDPPCGLYLRAQNMLTLYSGLHGYWQVIKQVLQGFSYQRYYACAYAAKVAKLLALQQIKFISDDKDKIHQHLLTCSLALSDIAPKDIEKLKRVGISDIRGVFSQPLASLANRLSTLSLRSVAELRGQAPTKLRFYTPSEHYHDYIELLYDVDLVPRLLSLMRQCFKPFEHFLLIRNALALQIDITLHQRDHDPLLITINSALPIYKSDDWLNIVALRFDRLCLQSGVYGLSIHCQHIEAADKQNADFFQQKGSHVAALTLISRLKAKLGENQVLGLLFNNDVRPEKAYTWRPKGHYKDETHNSPEACIYKDRPGLMLTMPSKLEEQVSIINGPERIVSGWWDKQVVTRDYFVAHNQQGQQLWLFKNAQNEWYIQGYFV